MLLFDFATAPLLSIELSKLEKYLINYFFTMWPDLLIQNNLNWPYDLLYPSITSLIIKGTRGEIDQSSACFHFILSIHRKVPVGLKILRNDIFTYLS